MYQKNTSYTFGILLFFYTFTTLQAQTTSGTVFRDFNGSGNKDTYEVGVAGVLVKAYNAVGVQLGATATSLASTGAWSIVTGTTDMIRVEFSIPTNANAQDYASQGGANYGSSVQFVAGNATNVNFALNFPEDYWDSNTTPKYTVPCYVNGLPTGTGSADAAIVSVPYPSTGLNQAYRNFLGVQGTGPMPNVDAPISQVGTVWGAAYHKTRKRFYFSTFLKRTCGMADGPGFIYNFDYSGVSPVLAGKFNLQGATPTNGGSSINFGTVTRTGSSDYTLPSDKTAPSVDLDAFAKVGAISMGDIDIQPGTDSLWVVNLFQKALIRVDISNNPISLPSNIYQYPLSSLSGYPTSATGVLRPWSLAFHAGKGYLGVVSDASVSLNDADLLAYVLQFDPNNMAAGFTQVLSFNPNVKRGTLAAPYKFHYWISAYAKPPVLNADANAVSYPQPILSDIDFDENGNMILSMMDRFGHQMGFYNYPAVSGASQLQAMYTFGDVLKACSTGTGWTMEGSGACGTSAEFFQDISGDANPESGMGASGLLKGKNQVLCIGIDPHPAGSTGQAYYDTQGIYTYNLTSGANVNWYSVYFGDLSTQLFGKANGLGDLEIITDPAPIEIGNRVWNDANQNGLQDANESGIGNVSLELYADFNNDGTPDGAVLATTSTATAVGKVGTWYFNASNVTDGNPLVAGNQAGLAINKKYLIRIGSADWTGGAGTGDLANLFLGTANIVPTAGLVDVSDNDATLGSNIPTIAYTTGSYGQNNHTLDFGFMPCINPNAPVVSSPVNNPCPTTTVNLNLISTALTPSVTGGIFEWHVSNDSNSALVPNPTVVSAGTYYLFEKAPLNCYSTGTALTVGIQVCCPPMICLPIHTVKNN